MEYFMDGNGKRNESTPYIVAEMNSSHNGKIETAIRMIEAAKDCGCDCVKFQSWSKETLYSEEYYIANKGRGRYLEKISLDEEALRTLAMYCREIGIGFSSTPYSKREVDFLAVLADDGSVPFIKISSMEINNLPFLRYIAKKGLPIVLSTGMATLDEIKRAVLEIEACGNNKICILHCVAIYPAAPEIINLNNIKLLQETFPKHIIGYSDHTIGIEVAAAATALGAALVEKHFTLDHTKMGLDNDMATEPDEMKNLVRACRNVHCAMGHKDRVLTVEEEEQKLKMRRSIISARDIKSGEVLTEEMLDAKRPGDGIPPDRLDGLIGKTIICDLKKGYQIRMEDLR